MGLLNFCGILLLVLSLTRAQSSGDASSDEFPAPVNLITDSNTNAVAVFWDPVENASQYYITLSDGQDQFTIETRIAFGGLLPNTTYTATVAAADINGRVSMNSASVNIRTRGSRVRGLRTTSATATSIFVEWDALQGGISYEVNVTNSENEPVAFNVTIVGTSANVTGLVPQTFYFILLSAMTAEGSGGSIMIRARTDGSGAFVMALWQDHQGFIGGEASVLRPISIPEGSYSILLNFSCPLTLVRVWNAEFDPVVSNLSTGIVIFTQSALWELEKTEIGLNFYYNLFDGRSLCTLTPNSSIPVTFGITVEPTPDEGNQTQRLIPLSIDEWQNTTIQEVRAAGIITISLDQVYDTTQPTEENQTSPKPRRGSFVITINPGSRCSRLYFRYSWSMTLKSTFNIGEADPDILYFVQEGTDWFSNDPGFIYGYDPFICTDRNSLFAEVLTGGSLIDQIINAPSVEPNY